MTPERGTAAAAAFALLLAIGPSFGGQASAQQEYRVALDAERTVRFVSRATMEEFDGVTERIDGVVYIDTDSLSRSTGGEETELYFEVDLASIDTGIRRRDRQMRENFLEVEEHPYAAFGGKIVRAAPLSGDAYRITAEGVFGVHGVERERSIVCDVTPRSGPERYRVRCGFEVLLSEHDIEIPKILFLELNNEIQVELDFTLEPTEESR